MELKDAGQLALECTPPAEPEWIGVKEALGRVLAKAIEAQRNLPGEARSRWDGFALRSSDTTEASLQQPALLNVVPAVLAAGHPAQLSLGPGECIRILTGAPLPSGTDSVVPQEQVLQTEKKLAVSGPVVSGEGVECVGEQVREGTLLLKQGDLLTPTRLALLAALGEARISVYRQPRVALLATGDELREPGESLNGFHTVCDSRLLLEWLVHLQGGQPINLGIVGDDPEAIAACLDQAQADLVISTGGMGRGDKDFLRKAWELLGITVRFDGINISPGKRSALGMRGKQMFWGLSGKPWGAQLVFERLIAPVLRKIQGLPPTDEPMFDAILKTDVRKSSGVYKAFRGILKKEQGRFTFVPIAVSQTDFLFELHDSFAYIFLGPRVVEVSAGSPVQVSLHSFPLLASALLPTGAWEHLDSKEG